MGASKKRTGSQKKPSKSKSTVASRRAARKAAGQAAQKAGKYKSIKASDAAKRARSRASERRRDARKAADRAAKRAAANKAAEAAKRGPSATRAATQRKAAANAAAERRLRDQSAQRAAQQRARTTEQQRRAAGAANNAAAVRAADRRREQRKASGQADQRRRALAAQMGRVRPKAKPEGMSLSRFKAGLYNLLPEGMRQAGPDTSGMTAKEKFDANPARQAFVRSRERRKKRRDRAADNVVPPKPTPEIDDFRPELPPEVMPPVMPPIRPPFQHYPGYGGGMMGGLGAFGYNPALMAFESQQGAGQVPYYMAAARNAQTPNMSPAFQYAAQNYDILGGMQRTAPRPMEMMSAAERAQIAGMNNFSTPNYNSPYDQFNFFSNMVGGGGGKGMSRPAPQMAGGLAPFMMGTFG